MPSLPNIPWTIPATLAAATFLVIAAGQAVHPLLAMRRQRVRKTRDRLLWLLIVLGCSLAPVFFLDMFRTVVDLLNKVAFPDAWTVPAATEGAFVFLYLLGLWLQRKGKPKAWLRWAPYPFAAASLFLNVYAAHGQVPAMVGHAAVTVAFFLPVLAAESAVHCLAVTDAEMRLRRELADAMTYARDLVRDQKGIWWHLRVPSLLRKQITRSRPPASVSRAVAAGAGGDGAEAWEKPVEDWVTQGLTRRENLAVKVTRKRAEIHREVAPEGAPERAPEVTSEVPAEGDAEVTAKDTSERTSRGDRTAVQEARRIARRKGSRQVPRELLLEAVGELYDGDTPPSVYRVVKDLPVGEKTAKELLAELASDAARGADVISIGAR